MTEAQRFSVLRSLPHVEVRFLHTKRTQEIEISRCGVLLGSCLRVFKGKKEISCQYFISEAGITYSNP